MHCILIAGVPASGKSTIARQLGARLRLPVISKDSLKEILFDEIGFSSRAEKVRLGSAAERLMYQQARCILLSGQSVILENNFEHASKEGLLRLFEESGCSPITVRLDGDMRVIHARLVARDTSPQRHRGHVVNDRYPEEKPGVPVPPLPYADFVCGTTERGMRGFDIGTDAIDVDETDIAKVDVAALAQRIRALMR